MTRRHYIVLGDTTDHGGTVVTARGAGPIRQSIFDKPVACVGDMVYCPKCEDTYPIIEGAINPPVTIGGIQVALEGCRTSCGAELIPSQALFGHEGDIGIDPRSHDALLTEALLSGAAQPNTAAEGLQVADATPGFSPEELSWLKKQKETTKKLELDYKIKLKRGGNRILTPLEIPSFSELQSGSTKNKEVIDFDVINKEDPADSITLEVLNDGNVIYTESNTSAFLPKGEHPWQWNGYDTSGILDTRILKSKKLMVRLTATQGNNQQVKELKLDNSGKEVDWIDARINSNDNTIEITLRPGFSEGKVEGKDTTGKITALSYKQLLMFSKQGLDHYWSRDGSRPNNIGAPISTAKGVYKVKVITDLNGSPKSRKFKLVEKLDPSFGRATSIFFFEVVYHNAGFWLRWNRNNISSLADDTFKYTAAHEIGHLILNAYAPDGSMFPGHSSTHKGTSTMGQDRLQNMPYPSSGEIDLMHYPTDDPTTEQDYHDYHSRSVAAEGDVKGLLWLTRVYFDD